MHIKDKFYLLKINLFGEYNENPTFYSISFSFFNGNKLSNSSKKFRFTSNTTEKVTDTIATFERTLVTPSRFDDFLNGDESALSKEEKAGLQTFLTKGCTACHTGIALGGDMNAFNIYATYKHNNVGDFKGDKNGMVKVPTLRNISQTAPYFHNGEIWNLKDAIKEMGRVQLGIKITDKEATSIETFLKSLDAKELHVTLPNLPASTDTTPKPNMN